MTLTEVYNSYKKLADNIPNWNDMTKSELANKYCDCVDSKDDIKANQYFSALVCKYWYMVYYISKYCASIHLSLIDCASILTDSITKACADRKWKDPTSELSKSDRGAETCINVVLITKQNDAYRKSNKKNYILNYNNSSLDEYVENLGDAYNVLAYNDNNSNYTCKTIINTYIRKNQLLKALLVDCIAYQNAFTSSKSISLHQIIKILKKADRNFYDYLLNTYEFDCNILDKEFAYLNSLSNRKLCTYIKRNIKSMQTDKEILALLC